MMEYRDDVHISTLLVNGIFSFRHPMCKIDTFLCNFLDCVPTLTTTLHENDGLTAKYFAVRCTSAHVCKSVTSQTSPPSIARRKGVSYLRKEHRLPINPRNTQSILTQITEITVSSGVTHIHTQNANRTHHSNGRSFAYCAFVIVLSGFNTRVCPVLVYRWSSS